MSFLTNGRRKERETYFVDVLIHAGVGSHCDADRLGINSLHAVMQNRAVIWKFSKFEAESSTFKSSSNFFFSLDNSRLAHA
jgi:hypothetical protein